MRKSFAPGVVSRRSISLLAVTLLTAVFAVLGPLVQPVAAAEAAVWSGDQLTYDGNAYSREGTTVTATDSRGRAGEVAYTWIETTSSGAKKAHTIFFASGDEIQAQDTATLIVYTYSPPSTYTNASAPTTITVKADLTGGEVDNDTGLTGSSCSGSATGSLGWMLCPISQLLSDGVDWMYKTIVEGFLEVPMMTTDDTSGTYEMWKVMRSIANVVFVIVFLIIVYSQITNFGLSNYSIKAMLPRLIIAALLVNLSYFIVASAVDLSNVLGRSLYAIFNGIRENISVTNTQDLSWSAMNTFIMGGGVVAGFAGLTIAGGAKGLGLLLMIGLVSVAIAALVAFVILAARQALIVVFVIISPLAFIANILPNTEKYFKKWFSSFLSLLLFFPIFSLLFGGSQLAGLTIIQRGISLNQVQIVLMGMVVQVIPLFLTPLIIRFSNGLLGEVAKVVGQRGKGFRDFATAGLKTKQAAVKAGYIGNTGRAANFPRRIAQKIHDHGVLDEEAKKAYEQRAHIRAQQSRRGLKTDTLTRETDQSKRLVEAEHQRHWDQRHDRHSGHFDATSTERELTIKRTQSLSKISQDKFEADQTDMNAGTNRYAGMNGVSREQANTFAQLTQDAQINAEIIARVGTRKAMAERKIAEIQAKSLSGKEATSLTTIDGETLQQYSAGIMGEEGVRAVVAQAKAQVSRAMLEDIDNISNTADYEVMADPDKAMDAFKNSKTMTERIAYMMSFAKQGTAGDLNLREAVVHMNSLGLSPADMLDFKELAMAKVQGITGKGEDLKRYFGSATADWSTLVNDPKASWLKASAEGFAASDPIAQVKILQARAQAGDESLARFISRLTPQNIALLKDKAVIDVVLPMVDKIKEKERNPASTVKISSNDVLGDTEFQKSIRKYAQYYN